MSRKEPVGTLGIRHIKQPLLRWWSIPRTRVGTGHYGESPRGYVVPL